MAIRISVIMFLGASLLAGASTAFSADPAAQHGVHLSPALLTLLRSEMQEINTGVQGIAPAIAAGDWKTIQHTGEQIRTSYIMEKQLTPAQAKELNAALPAHFKQLDRDFHRRADQLSAAAKARDAELAAFHYSRMLESCAACHAQYAPARFPGFATTPQPQAEHHH